MKLAADDQVKLLDFGLANMLGGGAGTQGKPVDRRTKSIARLRHTTKTSPEMSSFQSLEWCRRWDLNPHAQ